MRIAKYIKNMRIQGASEIAIYALKHLQEFANKKGFGRDFDHQCRLLEEVRPTAVVLHNVIQELRKDKSLKKLDELLNALQLSRDKIAKNGSKLFKKRCVVMTHCHSHEEIALLKANKNKIKYVYVTETRPFQQGVLTAKDLAKAHENVRFIVDSACGFFMLHTDFVIVGADALRKEGVVNKIGTLPLCITAKAFHKPVYIVADMFKIDHREHLHIEERPAKEIYGSVCGEGRLSSLRSVRIYNPVFDVTPWKYVDAVITEKGVFKPDEIKKTLRKKE